MRNLQKLSAAFIFLSIGMFSCSPKYYTPNSHNVPLLSEKGQGNLSATGNVNQLEFQGSYAAGNNFALIADGGLFIPKNLDNGNVGGGKFFEVGAGYFKPISENWVFETYGIVGLGSFENHLPSTMNEYPLTKGNLSANILRVGIQPNLGFKAKYFSAALSARIVNLSYSNISGDLVFDNAPQVDYLRTNSSNYLLEPALTLRAGPELVKLQLQLGYSANLTNQSFKQDNSFLTLGVNFHFN